MREKPLAGSIKTGEKIVSNHEIITFESESEWNSEIDRLKSEGKEVTISVNEVVVDSSKTNRDRAIDNIQSKKMR